MCYKAYNDRVENKCNSAHTWLVSLWQALWKLTPDNCPHPSLLPSKEPKHTALQISWRGRYQQKKSQYNMSLDLRIYSEKCMFWGSSVIVQTSVCVAQGMPQLYNGCVRVSISSILYCTSCHNKLNNIKLDKAQKEMDAAKEQ